MNRLLTVLLVLLLGVEIAAPAFAARRVVVRGGAHRRTTVVVRRGWPIRRPYRAVIVRPARTVIRIAPVTYLPLVVWSGAMIATAPARTAMVWEDGETIRRDEDWTEVTLNADSRGTRMWLQVVEGRVQFDWAELVFENGDTRVVDMKEYTRGPGHYDVLEFADGRKVDHVRLVARAKSDEARVVLKMQK
ncbi:MAG: hypothetical protein HOP12_07445 [Candidatus Eisenbacteria bacterium]|uniref:Uncharacterized protein n=1 Tax=Eiseniibacteriota bacterium TaxID=2212470 RepID=A0A849SE42_UNCEI|nr:hypothetical protein [Candidatus Eisenbacteria bacterium]